VTDVVLFSDAARLYAEHAAIVEMMQGEFAESTASFLDGLAAALQQAVRPEVFREKKTGGQAGPLYRSWWLADVADDRENHPLIWFNARQPSIVHPGRLELTVCAPKASTHDQSRYLTVAKQTSLANYSQSVKQGTWSLFRLVVPYAVGDPLEQVTAPISLLLLTLRKTEREILSGS
jgi:hypothetical protein